MKSTNNLSRTLPHSSSFFGGASGIENRDRSENIQTKRVENVQEELDKVREESRISLESSWADVERLKLIGSALENELPALENELLDLQKMNWKPKRRNSTHSQASTTSNTFFDRIGASLFSISSTNSPSSGITTGSFPKEIDANIEAASSNDQDLDSTDDETDDAFVPFVSPEERRRMSRNISTEENKIIGDEDSWYENDDKLDCDTDTTAPSLLSQVERSRRDELRTELRRKEAAIETLERTTSLRAQMISELQSELDGLTIEAEREEKTMDYVTDALKQEIIENENNESELEQQVSQTKQNLCQMEDEEEVLKTELHLIKQEIENPDNKLDTYIFKLKEKTEKFDDVGYYYDTEATNMRLKTDDALQNLSDNIRKNLPQAKGGKLIREIYNQFSILQEKEEALSEILASRIYEQQQTKTQVQAISKLRDSLNSAITRSQYLGNTHMESLEGGRKKDSFEVSTLKTVENGVELQTKMLNSLCDMERKIEKKISLLSKIVNDNIPEEHHNAVDAFRDNRKKSKNELALSLDSNFVEGTEHTRQQEHYIKENLKNLETRISTKEEKVIERKDLIKAKEDLLPTLKEEQRNLVERIEKESKENIQTINVYQQELRKITDQVASKKRQIDSLSHLLREKQTEEVAILLDLQK